MSGFDPDKHSLYAALRFIRSDHVALEENYDRVAKTLVEEFGFQIDEDIHLDDLRELIEADRSGLRKTWSSWRTYDEEIDYQQSEIDRNLENLEFDDDESRERSSSKGSAWIPSQAEDHSLGGSGFLPAPKYRVIYADPPWLYSNKKTGGSHKSGAAQQYRVMTQEEIKNLPVWKLAHPDGCVLFLWGTVPMPREPLDVMEAWGFTFKTTIFWEKLGMLGMGHWFRGQIEECHLGIRGAVKAFKWQKKNLLQAKRRNGLHSGKPEELRKLIEEVTTSRMPNCGIPRIELFARDLVPGWDHWGDEVLGAVRLIDGEWVVPAPVERSLVR